MPTLLKHQIEGISRIKQSGSLLLADEPGVGKTAVMIHATKDHPKVLILTLASLKYQMRDEILKWLPEAKIVVVDGNRKQREALWAQDVQYYICNYELLLRDMDLMQKI